VGEVLDVEYVVTVVFAHFRTILTFWRKSILVNEKGTNVAYCGQVQVAVEN